MLECYMVLMCIAPGQCSLCKASCNTIPLSSKVSYHGQGMHINGSTV